MFSSPRKRIKLSNLNIIFVGKGLEHKACLSHCNWQTLLSRNASDLQEMRLRKLNVANCGTSFSFGIQRHTTMMWIPGMTIKLVYLPHAYFIYPCYCYHPAGVISYLTRLHCIFAVDISQTDWLSKRYQNVSIKKFIFPLQMALTAWLRYWSCDQAA